MVKRLLYLCLEDVSLSLGPSVNERVFLKDMTSRFGDAFLALLPDPSRGLPPELATLQLEIIPAYRSVRSPVGWVQARLLGSLLALRAARQFEPDLLVMRPGALAVPHLVLALRSGLPYVLKTASDTTFQRFYSRHWGGRLLKPVNGAISRRLLHGARCIDVVSTAHRDTIIRLHPTLRDRVVVIDNGVDLAEFSPNRDPDRRRALGFAPSDIVVGYVGGFPMRRGGKEVVDVVGQFMERGDMRGLVVGDNGEADACRRYAEERGVLDRVVVTGEVDYSAVPGLMAAMDIGLSILRPPERGASEQKVRQYLGAGLCVVGTAGSNDFLRGCDFARVVETNHPEEVGRAVISLVTHGPEGLLSLGRKARQLAENEFSIAVKNEQRLEAWGGRA